MPRQSHHNIWRGMLITKHFITRISSSLLGFPTSQVQLYRHQPPLGSFTQMWKANISFVMPVQLSYHPSVRLNRLTPNDPYMGRTAPLTSKRCILYIYSTNIGTEYFKHALYSPFFSPQNAVCFIMLTCLVSVLFTFYIQVVLKLKKNNSGAKGLNKWAHTRRIFMRLDILVKFFIFSTNAHNYFKIVKLLSVLWLQPQYR